MVIKSIYNRIFRARIEVTYNAKNNISVRQNNFHQKRNVYGQLNLSVVFVESGELLVESLFWVKYIENKVNRFLRTHCREIIPKIRSKKGINAILMSSRTLAKLETRNLSDIHNSNA